MSKSSISGLVLLAVLCACKATPTNPVEGQKLRLITSDQDTTSVRSGNVEFTVTVLDASGYGVAGAYIDFYDPVQKRTRYEGPTPINGEWHVTDSIPFAVGGGDFEFAFVAEHDGATSSDSLLLWVHTIDIRPWIIQNVQVNSWAYQEIGVKWTRPAADSGVDTVFAFSQIGGVSVTLAPYPESSLVIIVAPNVMDTITVHNAFTSSSPVIWASASQYQFIRLYENGDSNTYDYSGLEFGAGRADPVDQNSTYYRPYVDLILATDPNNNASGVSLVSPSLTSLSGFSGGRVTSLYHPVQFIDSGAGLQELYYSNDLSTYTSSTPAYEIPLPDSSQYSTAFIAVTSDGHYAQVAVGPVSHDYNGHRYVYVSLSYQTAAGLPYAGRPRKHR